MKIKITQPIAFVTGSSRGIGKAVALRLAQAGFSIVLHGSHPSPALSATEQELKKMKKLVSTVCFDVQDRKKMALECGELLKKVGTISVLVQNAGIARDRTLLKMSEQEWDDVLQTNLSSVFFLSQHLLPAMKTQNFGRIINISSVVAQKGNFGQTNYAAAKAGLIGFTKALAKEVAKYGVTVNAVTPGLIETDLTATIPPSHREKLLSEVAMGRMGTPEEVANLVAFLASTESSYITGSVIDIHGGWL